MVKISWWTWDPSVNDSRRGCFLCCVFVYYTQHILWASTSSSDLKARLVAGSEALLSISFQTHVQMKGPYNHPWDLNSSGVSGEKQRNYSEGATFINSTPFSHERSTVRLTRPDDVWGRVCDTTSSHTLLFVCSAVCSNRQFWQQTNHHPFSKTRTRSRLGRFSDSARSQGDTKVHLSHRSEVSPGLICLWTGVVRKSN